MSLTSTVLIVDDDPNSIDLIVEYLDGSDFDIVTARDGEEAYSILSARPRDFDVLLTDRMMPRMNGMELLHKVKRNPATAHLPVIMVTAAAERKDIVEGISAGAYYYMAKPIDGEVLVSMVKAAAYDFDRFKELQRQVSTDAGTLGLMRSGVFDFRSPDEATNLGTFLAKACPDPERVVLGLSELLINAVEHGNLEISYTEKSQLNRGGRWQEEIEARLCSETFATRVATASFERSNSHIVIVIRDQGKGFDPGPYLQIDPQRVFDSHGRGIAIANLLSFDSLEYRDRGREVVGRIRL